MRQADRADSVTLKRAPVASDVTTNCDLLAVLDSGVLRDPVVLASGTLFCHGDLSRSFSGLGDDMLQVIVIQQ